MTVNEQQLRASLETINEKLNNLIRVGEFSKPLSGIVRFDFQATNQSNVVFSVDDPKASQTRRAHVQCQFPWVPLMVDADYGSFFYFPQTSKLEDIPDNVKSISTTLTNCGPASEMFQVGMVVAAGGTLSLSFNAQYRIDFLVDNLSRWLIFLSSLVLTLLALPALREGLHFIQDGVSYFVRLDSMPKTGNKKNDLAQVKTLHFIGIGGIGISALARLLLSQGKKISGTNDSESPETLDELRAQGVEISLDLEPTKLPDAECYIYSDAWLTNHPEVMNEARSRGVPCLSFYEALGIVARDYKIIAVAGAHGKTTTTAMVIDVLEAAGLDPMGWVGSLRAKTRSNFRAGKGAYFVSEADEYRRHFLNLTPYILIITNIDADHLDYYKDIPDIQSAFRELVKKVPSDGFIVCDSSQKNVQPVVANLPCTIVDYAKFFDPNLTLKVLPLNRINAAAALAVADILDADLQAAKKALADFSGTWRRFEYKGKTKNGALVYDDYAHHPLEITTTLKSVREQFPNKKIIVAFHPHLYSRTKMLMDSFAAAFADADDIVIAPIFAARESPDPLVTSDILAEKIRAHGKNARALGSFEDIEKYLRDTSRSGDIVITMGAGDIYKVAEALVA